MRHSPAAALVACALALTSFSARSSDYKSEYDKNIKATQNIGVLGPNVAGDQINFYTGATTFTAIDISIPGNNGLAVSLGRSYTVEQDRQKAAVRGDIYTPEIESSVLRAFGDWDLDIPYISTTMTQADGWVIDAATPTKRCSSIGENKPGGGIVSGVPAPRAKEMGAGEWTFRPDQYWHGYSLHLPGGSQSLLAATLTNPQRPSTGGPYYWTTNKDWWVSCLPATAAMENGEGFLAISPEGTKYSFDRLSRRNIASTTEFVGGDGAQSRTYHLYRAEFLMLPSRITDRFGNWVDFSWSNDPFRKLLGITSSDGRAITLTYNAQNFIATASNGTRTWQYTYANGSLSSVTLPDATSWQYSFAALNNLLTASTTCSAETPPVRPEWDCGAGEPQVVMQPAALAYVIHPSGARVDFEFQSHYQWGPVLDASYTFPIGLNRKTLSGPGLSQAEWNYRFAPTLLETKTACDGAGCPPYVWSDELQPDGQLLRRIFNLTGQLQAEFHGHTGAVSASGTPAVSCTAAYCAIAGKTSPVSGNVPTFYSESDSIYGVSNPPYIVQVGVDPLSTTWGGSTQTLEGERRLPVSERSTKLQGTTFKYQVSTFDIYARPLTVIRSSSGSAGGAFSRTESSTYLDDAALWVIGLPLSITSAGYEVSRTEYNAARLPWKVYSFGLRQQTLLYNPDGTLASAADGRDKVTTLANWYRGVPRNIGFPTGASLSATVNAVGTIASTTDDQLASTTNYTYDPLGRLTKASYPAEGTYTWNPQVRSFAPDPAPGYGLPAGVWKQIVYTGNGRTTTYYDALWQPVLVLAEDTADATTKSFVVHRYDTMGRRTFSGYPLVSADVNDPALKGTVTEYDALGRVAKVKQDAEAPLTTLITTTEYLPGFTTRVTNPRQAQITTQYQVFDAPSTDNPIRIDAPAGVSTVIERDALGAPLSITRSGPGA